MAATPATEPSRNTAKSHESILDNYITRASIRLHGKSPLMDFTIKVNRNTFLVVVPPEIITSSQVVKVCTHQTPLVHQGSPWCALVLQLKQPVRWIMNGESFIQSTGVGVLETLDEAPQLYKLASQTNFTMYFPHAVKGRVSRAFPPAPYPQLSDHLIAAPGKELWGNHALTLSSGRWWFNENVEPLPSYTPPPPPPSEAIQARAVPSSDTMSAPEIELAGYGKMVDDIAKRVKDQIAQEVERLADNCLNTAIKEISQFYQQQTDVNAAMENSRWLFGRTTEYADKVKSEMGAVMYDFEKEMKTIMQGFEEEQRVSIDGLETKLEAHQTGKLKEMLGRVLQTVLDGGNHPALLYQLPIFPLRSALDNAGFLSRGNAIELDSSNFMLVLCPNHRTIILQAQPPPLSLIARQKKPSRRPPKPPLFRPDRNTTRRCQAWPNASSYHADELALKI
ncbi:hypothetical protein V2G26_012881 [Clonostachys chloroleuca]